MTRRARAARRSLTLTDLRDESFIVNLATGDDAVPLRWQAEQRRHGLPARIGAKSTSIQEILTLVAAGRGVCLVPSTVAIHHPRTDIAYVPVDDADAAVVSLARRPGTLTGAVEAFVRTTHEVAEPLRGTPDAGGFHAV